MNNVRKLLIFLLSVSLTSAIAILSVNPVYANHQEDVLGVASAEVLSIPPTSEGPGLILPDSPLFFIDRLKQEFRLLLAFTPEQKTKIHNAIAGERLAELQIMLAKNNVSGIRTALQGVSDNLTAASDNLVDVKLTGRSIALLAKEINDSIKEKQKSLSVLGQKANGEIKAQTIAAREALKLAKVRVEENLPEDLLINETIDDLNLEIEDNVQRASDSAKGLVHAIDVLTRLASEAARNDQTRRQEALLHAIEVKSEALEKQQAKTVNIEEEKQKLLLEAKKEARKVNEGAVGVSNTQRKIMELKSSENSSSGNASSKKPDSPSSSSNMR